MTFIHSTCGLDELFDAGDFNRNRREGSLESGLIQVKRKSLRSRGFLRQRKLSGAKEFEKEPSAVKYKLYEARNLHLLSYEKLTRAEILHF